VVREPDPVFAKKSFDDSKSFHAFGIHGCGIKAAPRDIYVAPVQIEKNPDSRRAATDNTIVQSGFGDRRPGRFLCVGCNRGSAFRISQRVMRRQGRKRTVSMSDRTTQKAIRVCTLAIWLLLIV
jgi:hypothetical protein